jgi:hypothetical protein
MIVSKALARMLVFATALTASGQLLAAPLWCSGTLGQFYVTNNGQFLFSGSWRNDFTMICHLHQTWNGISPETCAFWYALMVTSKTNDKTVRVYYSDVPYTCETLPTYYASPGPGYVMQL